MAVSVANVCFVDVLETGTKKAVLNEFQCFRCFRQGESKSVLMTCMCRCLDVINNGKRTSTIRHAGNAVEADLEPRAGVLANERLRRGNHLLR